MFQARSSMIAPLPRIVSVLGVVLLASYAYVTLRGPRGIPALLEKQRQIEQLEQHNTVLARDIERQREHIRRLAENPAQVELEIRERLKLVHPGEKIFITGEPDKK
jgi:cell division protein FtsB